MLRTTTFVKLFLVLAVALASQSSSDAQNLNTLVNFSGPNGAEPRYLSPVQGSDGNLYGTTRGGGAHSSGTVFRMTPSGALTTLYSFCSQANCADGSSPDAGLALGNDGNFYGATTAGGSGGEGTIFKITPSGNLTTLHSFIGSDGGEPDATLLLASDGAFYGTTPAFGAHGFGTVYKITSSGTLTTVYNFCSQTACSDGGVPFAGLAQGNDGNFYGTTSLGGGDGTVFKLTPGGVLTTLHTFTGADGSSPYGKLLLASDGNFYGTTSSGGTSHNCTFGCGTVFKITLSGAFTSLHSFSSSDGSYIIAGLIEGGDGNLYGTAGYGGNTQNCGNGCGTVFKITKGGALTVLHSFMGFPSEGSLPVGGLLQASNGIFYGTTEAGGSTGDGSVFSLAAYELPTTTVVTSAPNPSQVGQMVTITATVMPSGPPAPSGTVSFADNGLGIPSCMSLPLMSGMAVCTTTSLPVGTDTLVAIYSGDSNYQGSTGTASQIVNPLPSPVEFISITPCRIVDTRGSDGPFGGPEITGHNARSFPLAQTGNPCNIPAGAVAYSLNVAVVPQGRLGYLTIWPTGEGQPLVATLNSPDGRTKANAAIVPAGSSNGSVSVYVTDTTNVILDINGYFIPSGMDTLQFYPLTPCRVADTRSPDGPLGGPYLTGDMQRNFPVLSSNCNIPNSAVAYSLNFAAIPRNHQHLGYLTVWPQGQVQPLVSTLNDPTGTIVANAGLIPAGIGGGIATYPTADTDLVIDVNGYFAPPGTGGLSLYVLTPCRVLDTRNGNGTFNGMLTFPVMNSACSLPEAAQAYVFNATVIPDGPLGYLTLWPHGEMQPLASTLNAVDGAITSNMAVVPNIDGQTNAYAAGTTQLIMDISSYFAP